MKGLFATYLGVVGVGRREGGVAALMRVRTRTRTCAVRVGSHAPLAAAASKTAGSRQVI